MATELSHELKNKVFNRVKELIQKTREHHGITLPYPNVTYDLRGTVGGRAHHDTYTIQINPILLVENEDHYIHQTIGHEWAHLVTRKLYPYARASHGRDWQHVMRTLGLEPNRTHNYDVTNARVRKTEKFNYKCDCCGKVLKMGKIRHNRTVSGKKEYLHGTCGSAGTLTFIG